MTGLLLNQLDLLWSFKLLRLVKLYPIISYNVVLFTATRTQQNFNLIICELLAESTLLRQGLELRPVYQRTFSGAFFCSGETHTYRCIQRGNWLNTRMSCIRLIFGDRIFFLYKFEAGWRFGPFWSEIGYRFKQLGLKQGTFCLQVGKG